MPSILRFHMPHASKTPLWLRYSLPFLGVGVMVFARLLLVGWMEGRYPLILFIVPVILSTWVGGVGPGLLTVLIGFVAGASLSKPYNLDLNGPVGHERIVLFTLVSVSCIFIVARMAIERQRAEQNELKLQTEVLERAAAESELRVLNDTLESRVAERTAALIVKEARLRAIFETSYQFQGLLTTDGLVVDANKTSLAAIDARLGDIIGIPYATTAWFKDTTGASEKIARAIPQVAQGNHVQMELRLSLPTGVRDFHFSLRPIASDDGMVIAIVPEAIELTEQRRAQRLLQLHRDTLAEQVVTQTRDLILAKESAESANVAKSEFLANMSHEIRTPMNAVIGLANILEHSAPLTPKQREFIGTLKLSADALLTLINDMLDIAKIESRSVDLEIIAFDLRNLLDEVRTMLLLRAAEKQLTLTVDASALQSSQFLGDPARIQQILLNLAGNAIKFTERGTVSINVHATALDAQIDQVFITVRDSGIGIAPEKLSLIFDKFVQGDSSINRKYGGSGLGLAITKALTEIMGGSLDVESHEGKGSAFTVSLPLKKSSDAATPRAGGLPSPTNSKERYNQFKILLVEDSPANVLVATSYLEQFGFHYDVARDGHEALAQLQQNNYLAILMDVQMAGLDGLEATRTIRRNEAAAGSGHIPIIGMTAHAIVGDRETCLQAGMDDYISKPFDPADLEDRLQKIADNPAL